MFSKRISGSIKKKGLLALILTVSMLVTFVLFYFPAIQEKIIKTYAEEQVSVFGESLSISITEAITKSNYQLLEKIFNRLKEDNHVKYVGIYDEKDKLIVQYPNSGIKMHIDQQYGLFYLKNYESYAYKIQVVDKDIKHGFIYILYSIEFYKQQARKDLYIFVGTAGILLLLGGLGFGILFGKTASNIIKLRNAAIIAGNGNLEVRIARDSNDEVGDLTDAFNKMMDDIKRINNDLEIEKKSVEAKVVAAVAELDNSYKFIHYVIDAIKIPIIAVDNNKLVTLYNSMAGSYVANTNSPGNKLFYDLFPDFLFVRDLLNKSMETKSFSNDTMMIQKEDGELKYFNVFIYPFESNTGNGAILMLDDITEKRNMEQLMIQAEKMTSVAGLAAGMAHEINNPLGTIVQGCQNIIRRTQDGLDNNTSAAEKAGITIEQLNSYLQEREVYHIVNTIKNAATKASEIVASMLHFSRTTGSKMVRYDICKLIDETIELAYNDYNLKKKYDFRIIELVRIYEDNIPELRITVTEIQQVIFNILQNAAQAMKMENDPVKKPKITIKVYRELEQVKIEVEDNGPGMSSKIMKRIFEPFYTTKDIGEGTGLGLSVSYMIVKNNHKGNITVTSIIKRGTTFTITLPIIGVKND